MVDHQSGLFKLETLPADSISGSNPVRVAAGDYHRINMPLTDAANENSALISYFETGISSESLKNELTGKLVMQVMQQPFFNDLRTNQQLGYVVDARQIESRHVMGYRFLIQSAAHSAEYCIGCINKFLLDNRKVFQELSDTDFEQAREAINIDISEKDINLSIEASRLYNEICVHTYVFDRQDKEIATLQEVTKAEVQAFFENIFFAGQSKRIDFELQAANHAEDNAKAFETNKEGELFKDIERKQYDSIESFKENVEYYDDFVAAGYREFIKKEA